MDCSAEEEEEEEEDTNSPHNIVTNTVFMKILIEIMKFHYMISKSGVQSVHTKSQSPCSIKEQIHSINPNIIQENIEQSTLFVRTGHFLRRICKYFKIKHLICAEKYAKLRGQVRSWKLALLRTL